MKNCVVFVLALAVAAVGVISAYPSGDEAKLWGVLVAGSNGYYNYRHQADVCHAYQILRQHGIPDERIIVMMYDDIANSEDNPTKGIIINHPDGSDVYHDVPKDYTGEQVTPQNFLNVLKGNKAAMSGVGSGKVLESGPNDHVFVFFSDHGAPGLVAFPSDYLYAKDLVDTLNDMHTNNRYGKLVFYLEACESGSMFENLLAENINIFATTASSAEESSYACYYDDVRQTYLGDVYSVKWMEDSDAEDITQESLEKQYTIVKEETTTSAVHQYGNITMGNSMVVSEFQGMSKTPARHLPRAHMDAVNSRDVPLAIIRKKIASTYDENTKTILEKDLKTLQRNRSFLKGKVEQIVKALVSDEKMFTKKSKLVNHDCYKSTVAKFHHTCFNLSTNPYALGLLQTFVNLCESGVKVGDISATMDSVCTHPKVVGIV